MSATMVGRQIGRYLLNEELGRGGMGVVYKATQVTLNRTVAIKMLPPHLATSREYLARFRREAETLSRLSHEHIVHIYDVDESEGSHYIVMEFVDGPSLTSLMARRGHLTPACARDVAMAVAGALTVAHRQGIVHRDIKPDNILVTSAGQPKLTDFGIAHMRDGRLQTQAGTLLGTPYYMSPEQATGREISAATDVYSLAVVLYEMVSGRVPFDAEDPLALALKHVQEEPPPLQRIASSVPEALAREVHRALRKDPRERHANAQEFRDRLAALDLGIAAGTALGLELATRSQPGTARCPECATPLSDEFITCPHCGLSIKHRCTSCGRLYDALSPACPTCKAPATPPELRMPAGRMPTHAPAPAAPSAAPASPAAPSPSPTPAPPAGALPVTVLGGNAVAGALDSVTRENPAAGPAQPPPADGPKQAALAAGGALAARAAVELRDAADDLVSFFKRLRDPSAPAPTRRQFVVAGLAATLLVFLVLAIWRPWQLSAPAVSILPPPGDTGPQPRGFEPPPSTTRRPATPAPTPPVVATDPAPAPTSQPQDRGSAARVDSTSGSRGAGREATQADSSGAGTGSRAGSGAAGASAAGSVKPEAGAPADVEGARRAIDAIIERQRRATETGNVDLLTEDLADDLAERSERQLEALHEAVRNLSSRISNVRVQFNDATHATVRFRALVAGVRKSDSRPVTVYDGEVQWRLEYDSGEWLITWTSGS
jgi:predicted Ser/Thr protein kinase